MSAEQFRISEDSYYKLRGQFDTGRISQEQFDEKLRELMVQDAQGRYWMLGADSGKWYYYDGANWVHGDPLDGAAAVAAVAAATPAVQSDTAPARTEPARATAIPSAIPEEGHSFPLVPILVGMAIVILGIGAFLLFQNRDRLFLAQQPPTPITPILPPTITRAPSPTPRSDATNVAAATSVPTPIPQTLAPLPTVPAQQPTVVTVPTEPSPIPVTVVVTTEPTATTQPPTDAVPTTGIPSTTPIQATATDTPRPPTNTPVPSFPPDVYVTALNINPNPAFKNQPAAFTATFLNTTGAPRGYNWVILLYDPNKNGPNKGFGESTQVPITIPVGQSTHTINHVPATGPGGCVQLYAQVGWKNSAFDKPIFPNTSGDPVTVYFDVCPP